MSRRTPAQQAADTRDKRAAQGAGVAAAAAATGAGYAVMGVTGGGILSTLAGIGGAAVTASGGLLAGVAAPSVLGVATLAAAPVVAAGATGLGVYALYRPSKDAAAQKIIDDNVDRVVVSKRYMAFISYNQALSSVPATALYNEIKNVDEGLKIFLDKESLNLDLAELAKEIGNSESVVVFVSDNYVRSPNCVVELCAAVEASKHVVVVDVCQGGKGFAYESLGAIRRQIVDALENDSKKKKFRSKKKNDMRVVVEYAQKRGFEKEQLLRAFERLGELVSHRIDMDASEENVLKALAKVVDAVLTPPV